MHQDSTYVRVSSPLELAASWIAPEDIQPGSGELEYYVGTHRLEPYLFEGTKKWMPPNSPEHDRYLVSLHEQSQALGLERQTFLPMKGDALIWSADLAHDGSEVATPVSRKSFVTHYCPLSCEPIYGDDKSGTSKIRFGDAAYYCAVGRP
jgi:ectoine hydroxylase-related dioxygenase (phytanoyl-CoA dioxygenase family)